MEAHGQTGARSDQDLGVAVCQTCTDQTILIGQVDRNDAIRADVLEISDRCLLDGTFLRGHEDVRFLIEGLYRQVRRHLFVGLLLDHVGDRPSLCIAAAFRNVIHLDTVYTTTIGEEQQEVMRGGAEDVLYIVIVIRARTADSPAALVLTAVVCDCCALDIAIVRDRDDDLFISDHVFDREVTGVIDDLCAALIAVFGGKLCELFANDLHLQLRTCQDGTQSLDRLDDLTILLLDLLTLQTGKALKTHVENSLRLYFAEVETRLQSFRGSGCVLRLLDRLDNGVDIIKSDDEAFQDVGTLFGCGKIEARPTNDHFVSVLDELFDHLLQRQNARTSVDERKHDDTKGDLHLCVLVQIVQHDHRNAVALEFDHDAHTFAI